MKKTISVFFSGTGFRIDSTEFLAASFFQRTVQNETQIKMGFDGCGVLYPLSGTIFGTGLDEQCDEVIKRVEQEIAAGHEITLNIYGHSRGGIAGLFLAKQLSQVDPSLLSINLAMLDPVPGNLITTANLDPFDITLANKAMDLSDCKPLEKVLALYPYIPLSAIACHAPLFVTYPEQAEVDEDVVIGCHAEAEGRYNSASITTALRFEAFFLKNGTLFSDLSLQNYEGIKGEEFKNNLLFFYNRDLAALNAIDSPIFREAHSARSVCIQAKPGAKFLNKHHQRLAGGLAEDETALSVAPKTGFFAYIQRQMKAYPIVTLCFKWTAIGLGLSSILYLTGGLAALPLIGTFIAKMGVLSILAAAPVLAASSAAKWYALFKPALNWICNRLFYPHYKMREITPAETLMAPESTVIALNGLSDIEQSKQGPTQNTAPVHHHHPLNNNQVKPASMDYNPTLTLSLSSEAP